MRFKKINPLMTWFLTCVVLTACGSSSADQSAELEERQEVNDQVGSAANLPTGHPPLSAPVAGAGLPELPPGSGSGETALSWDIPEGWIAETPSSSMRRAQYRVQGEAGDGECVVYYFGPGQGGDPQANALRWADQFGQPDGSSSRDAMRTRDLEVAGLPVLLVEVGGVYSGGMAMMGGPQRQHADYMLLGAIAQGPDANWFFKFTGPAGTVTSQQQAFDSMIRSLRRGGGG